MVSFFDSKGKVNIVGKWCIAVIRFYQQAVSPYLGKKCRFQPTCSHYAIDAISAHGVVKGCYLFLKRFIKCHPWGSFGYDPVPPSPQDKNSKV